MVFAPALLFFFQLSMTYNIWRDTLPVTLTTKKMEEKLLLAVSVNHKLNLTEIIMSVTDKSRFVGSACLDTCRPVVSCVVSLLLAQHQLMSIKTNMWLFLPSHRTRASTQRSQASVLLPKKKNFFMYSLSLILKNI